MNEELRETVARAARVALLERLIEDAERGTKEGTICVSDREGRKSYSTVANWLRAHLPKE